MPKRNSSDTKIYVLDTNILLHEPHAFLSFKEHDVVIPMTVLEELDYIKDSKKDVARDARVSIRAMEDLLHDATPEEMLAGVTMEGMGAGSTAPSGSLSIFTDLNRRKPSRFLLAMKMTTALSMWRYICKRHSRLSRWCW